MRIPFPERIKPWHAGCFATLLCLLELLEGTSPVFTLCVFVYIMFAVTAFNLAGGLYTASGAFIFSYSALSLLAALCIKAIIGEAADLNLRDPLVSINVYMASMAGILLAISVSRRLRSKRALLELGQSEGNLRQIAMGCIATGILLPLVSSYLNSSQGTVGSALNQFQEFIPLGLVLATYDQITRTKGRSSMNGIIALGSLYVVLFGGILSTSKAALFTPLASYVVVCGALRYRLRSFTIAGLSLICFVMFYYLVPYDQIVRIYVEETSTFSERWDGCMYWMGHLDEIRKEYSLINADIALSHGPHYYSEDRGILERFGMIAMDDALINITDINGTFGYQPMIVAVDNLIPHFIWPDKPTYNYNNTYGHEIGVLAYEDISTSVSFSSAADAYHMGGWYGVFLLLPLVMIILFVVVDSIAGNIKRSPWGLAYTVFFLHAAPESSLGSCFDNAFISSGILVITVYLARYILPIIANAFLPEHRRLQIHRKAFSVSKPANLSALLP